MMLSTYRATSTQARSQMICFSKSQSQSSSSSSSSSISFRCLSTTSTGLNQSTTQSRFSDKLSRVANSTPSRQSDEVQTPGSGQEGFQFKTPTSASQDSSTQSLRVPNFRSGQLYDPSALSPPSQERPNYYKASHLLGPKKSVAIQTDPIHQLNLHPGKPSLADDSYKNAHLLSSFVSEMGRILPRAQTRLTRRSQREIGKAVRRARNMGLIPNLSRGVKGAGWGN